MRFRCRLINRLQSPCPKPKLTCVTTQAQPQWRPASAVRGPEVGPGREEGRCAVKESAPWGGPPSQA